MPRTAVARSPASLAVAYVRVSTEDQAHRDKTSLPHQRRAVHDLATKLGATLTDNVVFEDPGRSGATAEARPGFMALVHYCKAHPQPPRHPGFVLVYNDSRWGRFEDPEEATYWRVELKRSGWRVRFAEGDEDGVDPLGRSVMRTIHSASASAERQAIKARAKMGGEGTARAGWWQNEAPLGYRRLAQRQDGAQRTLEIGQRKADDEKVKLTPGPAREVAVVRFMFTRYASGEVSLGDLARELDRRFPHRRWSRPTVRQVLRNRTYLGELIWGRRPHDREEARVRDRSSWIVVQDAHPALVTRALFAKVQECLRRNHKETTRTRGGYPLSGLITCAQCGEPYTGGGGPINYKDPADRDRYRFYRDRGAVLTPPKCTGAVGTLQKRWVEPLIISEVAKVVSHPRVQKLIAQEFDHAFDASEGAVHVQRRALEEERARLEAARERLVGAIGSGTLKEGEARPELERVRDRTEAISRELERLRFSHRRVKVLGMERERLLALAADFGAQARRLSGAALRELLRPWLAGATVDKERRKLLLTIRRLPAEGTFLLARGDRGRDSR